MTFRKANRVCSQRNSFSPAVGLCQSEVVTRMEKLLADLIALPSVNPAFAPQSGTATRPVLRGSTAEGGQAGPAKHGEKKVADFLASVVAKAGLEVELQNVLPGRANLIVRLFSQRKTRQTIVLAPHLDTVDADDSQFVPRTKNGRLYGRGACDTKGSIAAMFTALCELAESKNRPRETEIIFAGLIDEEHAQAGSRALVAQASRLSPFFKKVRDRQDACPTLAIVGEPTRLRVVTAHKGSLWLRLETRGKAAHGATPQLGRNAVREMACIVEALETEYASRLRRRKHPLLGAATASVGTICGGTQPNIVPDRCVISIDRRTLPGETEAGVRREIAAFLRAKRLSANISSVKLAPALPMETNPNLPLVRQFLQSIGQTEPAGVDYFCDAAVLADAGIPSVVFGPGDIAQAHTTDEWISLAELERGKDLLLNFLKSLP